MNNFVTIEMMKKLIVPMNVSAASLNSVVFSASNAATFYLSLKLLTNKITIENDSGVGHEIHL